MDGGPKGKDVAQPEEQVQLTALHCELTGVADLAGREGADAAGRIRRGFLTLCERVFASLPGQVAERSGESRLVYFWKHEDDTQIAMRAALTVVKELEEIIRRDSDGWSGRVRVAAHSATATVAGVEGSGDAEVIPFVAERDKEVLRALLGLRGGGGVFLSRSTYDLIERRFDCAKLDEDIPTGDGGRAEAFRLLAEKDRNRFVYKPTPLVGREDHLRSLLDRWALAKEGETQVVFLSGDSGSGKSRLLYELRERVKADAPVVREWQCWLQYQNTSLHPLIDMLERVFGFRDGNSTVEKRAKLERGLVADGYPLGETIGPLAALLSLSPPPPDLTPQALKENTLGVLVRLLRQAAERGPVLLLGEDLHWCDPTTLDLLGRVFATVRDARVLMVLTYRTDEFKPPWRESANQTSIRLGRLPREEVARMIAAIAKQKEKELSAEEVERVAQHAEGRPLFVEELTLAALAGYGGDESAERPIPATLVAPLASTLERLGSAKETAQSAAVIGREFSSDLLAAVSGMTSEELEPHLRVMIEAEVAYPIGRGAADRFLFKHILIREAAYDSVPPTRRRNLHMMIARSLEARAGTPPELLADHFTKAKRLERAVFYWQAAGDAALVRSANVEATRHYERGLEILKDVAEGLESDRLALPLWSGLSMAEMFLQGFGSDALSRIHDCALRMAERIGQPLGVFQILDRMCVHQMTRGNLEESAAFADRLLRLAETQDDSSFRREAYFTRGAVSLYYGDAATTAELMRDALDCPHEEEDRARGDLFSNDAGFAARGYAAWAGTILADFAPALGRLDELTALGRRVAHPFRLSFALFFAAIVHSLRLDLEATERASAECVELSLRQGFPLWLAGSKIIAGWVNVQAGNFAQGIPRMEEGFEEWMATGARGAMNSWSVFVAEAYCDAGRLDEGMVRVKQALQLIPRHKARYYESELYRVKARLLLAASPTDPAAERALRRAVGIAQKQKAAYFEIRAGLELAKLYRRLGRPDKARNALEPVRPHLSADMAPREVVEARRLLESVAAGKVG